jgi:DNA modification methylase
MEILKEFQDLIPPLTNEEYKQLENNCLEEGIREKIITWNNYIIDGHNRYKIAQQWNLDYQIESKSFKSKDEVKEWMILNQFGRRNLSNYQRSVLALQLEDVFRAKAKESKAEKVSHFRNTGEVLQKSAKPDTRKELSKVAAVSHDTIAKVKKIQEKAPEEIKQKLRTGEVSINAAYKKIKKEERINLIKTTKEERQDVNKNQAIIYNEPCIDFLQRFENNSVDLLFTDPPYSTDLDNVQEFVNSWLLTALNKVKETGRAFICIGAYPIEIFTYLKVLLSSDWIVDNPLVWTYRNTLGVTPKMKYNLNYQFILHLYKENSKPLDNRITNEMFSVQDINAPDGRIGNRYHTWQKPNELAIRLINHTTKENDIIIDPFACTGTFILNGADLGRKTFGCDIDINAINIAYERGCKKV